MVWLNPTDSFDIDRIQPAIAAIASRLVKHDSGWHSHKWGQLLFTFSGSVRIWLPGAMSILPPIRVAWIPPNVAHRVCIRSEVEYRSIYLDPTRMAMPFEEAAIVTMTPLLREVFERISFQAFDTDWSQGAMRNVWAVCMDELKQAHPEPMLLPVPSDPRLAKLDLAVLPPPLSTLSDLTGLSTRTITRIFLRETRMSYQAWRQSWRLLQAVDLLAMRARVTHVASELGFASDSAFIAFFRQMAGDTPKRYLDKHQR